MGAIDEVFADFKLHRNLSSHQVQELREEVTVQRGDKAHGALEQLFALHSTPSNFIHRCQIAEDSVSSHHQSWTGLRWTILAFTLSLLSAFIMFSYDRSSIQRFQVDKTPTWETSDHDWMSLHLTRPKPSVFVGATLTYGWAMLALYHLRRTDQYQAQFLACGIMGATTIGIASSASLQSTMLSIAPSTMLAALVLSSGFHYWFQRIKPTTTYDGESWPPEKP